MHLFVENEYTCVALCGLAKGGVGEVGDEAVQAVRAQEERRGNIMDSQNRSSSCMLVALESYAPFTDFTRRPTPHNFRGIMMQVLAIIAERLNVCMEYTAAANNFFGRRLDNGTWTGMMGMLKRKEVDMSGTPMTVSDERLIAMDPSVHLYMDIQTLIYKRPRIDSDLMGFVRPFTLLVWVFFGIALVVMSGAAFVIDSQYSRLLSLRYSYPSSSPSMKTVKEQPHHRSISLADIFQWTFGIFVGQCPEWRLRGFAMRVTAAVWIFMTLIISVVYRSNLKAMLISPKLRLPFDNVEEFLETDIPVLVLKGSMMDRLSLAAPPGSALYRLRQQAIEPHHDTLRGTFDCAEGLYTVVSSGLGAENAINFVYSVTKSCPMYCVKKPIFSGLSMSMGYTKGFVYRAQIDNILQQLRDTGILAHLYNQALSNFTKCTRYVKLSDTGDSRRALDLGDFYGVFTVFVGGEAGRGWGRC
ncbi:glutamate receptor ionotropic, delta-1-like isoform X2 [Portunus trituberculatus]|uniref:glutamate receptor ionotropic, delta-1-like isoform X2 n=1 Tax=Portunus trituberculatus TaxID=210409 RepID=UPI001E1CFA4B|nr:glutamate receptor ionotropic, delta-1-like isoform X2 [Portunus trituberculatus]